MPAQQKLTRQASCQHAYLLCDAEAAGDAGGVYEGIWHLWEKHARQPTAASEGCHHTGMEGVAACEQLHEGMLVLWYSCWCCRSLADAG